ncbi:T6SS effector amidase Tae4 family protein [Helicobacter bilis]|uniref:T6SS effector amidase Tae4 family protein n=1 Tax=Helicobacter bilis TaxID=37372 RepID=UPI00248E5A6E|nr:T6SS effector amidase Tae4 family protein [Helicobacter bilis]
MMSYINGLKIKEKVMNWHTNSRIMNLCGLYQWNLPNLDINKWAGNVEELFNSNQRRYVNTCALRVSYALNHSTHPINTMDKQVIGRGYQGKDEQTYYLGVFDIIELLKLNWKELSWNKSTYTQIIEKIKCGCSEDFYTSMNSKKENENFFEELQSIQRKGIVAMIGTDGLRHTTLWNGNDFVDTALGVSGDFLNHPTYIIRELYFWDLL